MAKIWAQIFQIQKQSKLFFSYVMLRSVEDNGLEPSFMSLLSPITYIIPRAAYHGEEHSF